MSTCPRLFEAEALRDGRLNGAERASYERHLAACGACTRELGALDALADALRASSSENHDELHARRERTRLLAAFDRQLVATEPPTHARRWLLGSAAGVALIAAFVVIWSVRREARTETSRAIIHAGSATAWFERVKNHREVVTLEHGALWIHVERRSGAPRLLVVLPDGELEDTGTTFTVSADNRHTTRVAVRKGSVVLRLRGESPVAIGAGDVWTPSAPPAPAPACPSSALSSCAAPSAAPSSTSTPREPPTRATAPASGLARDPSAGFRAAMAALNRGDDREAAEKFASFVAAHPSDLQAEDAAYLRVIALQRTGDRAAMKQAALEYLHRYPAGFRRAEVQKLVR